MISDNFRDRETQKALARKQLGIWNELDAFLYRLRQEEVYHAVSWQPKLKDYHIRVKVDGGRYLDLVSDTDGNLKRKALLDNIKGGDAEIVPEIRELGDAYTYIFGE